MLRNILTAASALALAACATGPDYAPPATPSAAAGKFVAATSPAVDPLTPVQADWWRLYRDPVLDQLVGDALAANTDVRQSVARLEKARAALREVKTDRLPEVGIGASGNMSARPLSRACRRSPARPGGSMPAPTSTTKSTCSAASAATSRRRAATSARPRPMRCAY